MRYPIFLSQIEKHIAQTIVEAFGQSVCGFDILRTKGFFPVVCDVNGWSFVKGNQKYYDDCADLIQSSFYEKLSAKMASNPRFKNVLTTSRYPVYGDILKKAVAEEDEKENQKARQKRQGGELRSVLVIMRHGDRKPKEKLKFKTHHPIFLQYIFQGTNEEFRVVAPFYHEESAGGAGLDKSQSGNNLVELDDASANSADSPEGAPDASSSRGGLAMAAGIFLRGSSPSGGLLRGLGKNC